MKIIEEITAQLNTMPQSIERDTLTILLSQSAYERLISEEGIDSANPPKTLLGIPIRVTEEDDPDVAVIGGL